MDAEYGLEKNPFKLLGVNLRDGRQQISAAADDLMLMIDQIECSKAKSILINPRDRIHAELSWFPGISPRRASALFENLINNSKNAISEQNIPALCRINMLCYAMERGLFSDDYGSLQKFLGLLTDLVDNIDFTRLQDEINEDRVIAKFPPVTDANGFKEAFYERLDGVVTTIIKALDNVPTNLLVAEINIYADNWILPGQSILSPFAESVLLRYESQCVKFLIEEAVAIDNFILALKKIDVVSYADFHKSLNDLKHATTCWVNVARPVLLLYEAQGQKHRLSRALANAVSDLARYVAYELQLTNEAIEIAEFCVSRFFIDSDLKVRLEDSVNRLKDRKRDEEIEYKATVGLFFKSYLNIKNQIISFKGHSLCVKKITRLRWAVSQENSEPKRYRIGWGNDFDELMFLTFNAEIFTRVRDILLDLIGYRIAVKYITKELGSGRVYVFPDISISDDSVLLKKRGLLVRNQQQSFGWKQIALSSFSDRIRISAINDSNFYVELNYLDFWNINVLAILIEDNLKKDEITKLSLTYQSHGLPS